MGLGPRFLASTILALGWLAIVFPARSAAQQPPANKPASPRFSVSGRTASPLLVCDRPYEDYCLAYFNVIREGHEWRLWYTAYDHHYRDDRDAYFCYAQSDDGLHWVKPSLGLVDYHGNRDNNILIDGQKIGGLHGQTVFVDPAAPAAERYKMVYTTLAGSQWVVYGARSPQGIKWSVDKEPLLRFNSDTQTVCLPDGKTFRLYLRMWTGGDFKGLRSVGYSESSTFGSFPPPVEILAAAAHDPPRMDFYNSAATKLAADSYVLFPSAFYHDTDGVLPHLATSRDGRNFTRVGTKPFLQPGRGFDSKCLYVAPGVIAGERPGTWWFYYLGNALGHNESQPKSTHNSGGFGRFLLSVE